MKKKGYKFSYKYILSLSISNQTIWMTDIFTNYLPLVHNLGKKKQKIKLIYLYCQATYFQTSTTM